ncbi:hypothetical protein, partial [uncultured Helicobacter sp.]|uniref:hypothetical protein n=1 Tax=uncultured Helicobacter sp. TaxID=175537 RepID=UPI00262B2966
MLPLLEIEKINQKSAVKTQNSKNVNESKNESDGFAEIFNFLSSDKNVKKSEIKSKNIPSNVQVDFQDTDKLLKSEKNQSKILKSLDEKYNLSKNFLDSQRTEVQTKNIKTKFSSNSSLSLPTNITLKNAKDLLEFSKTQKQETKTLKDLSKVADDLKLNVQKISMQAGDGNQVKNPKDVIKQEILPAKEVLILNENLKTNLNVKSTQKTNKESPNILSSLLQDKELIDKASKSNSTQKTTDSKELKLTSQDSISK